MRFVAGGIGGAVVAFVFGDAYRLTPGTLTLASLVCGFGTAIAVAYINTRSGRGLSRSGEGKPSGELEEYAAHRLAELEHDREELTARCNRLSMELASAQELLRENGISPSG